jgi:hypothetical protein
VAQLADFIDNLVDKKQSEITIDDGVAAIQAAVAATSSCLESRIVNVSDF